MTRTCICYSTDEGYLFPTLLSALQARAQSSEEQAGVCILGVDLDEAVRTLFGRICDQEGILLICVGRDRIHGLKTTFGRLFLDELLPPEFERILYIDGDTQIRAPLDELLGAELQPMRVMGTSDPIAFIAAEGRASGARLRVYMDGLGFQPHDYGDYFNAGVLYAGRADWARASADALEFFRTKRGACHFLDQSALNAVSRQQHLPMSLRWNFPSFLMNCGLEQVVQPVIYHFMSNPRPWNGTFPPWTYEFVEPYDVLGERYPQMLRFRSRLTARQRVNYMVQQRYR